MKTREEIEQKLRDFGAHYWDSKNGLRDILAEIDERDKRIAEFEARICKYCWTPHKLHHPDCAYDIDASRDDLDAIEEFRLSACPDERGEDAEAIAAWRKLLDASGILEPCGLLEGLRKLGFRRDLVKV